MPSPHLVVAGSPGLLAAHVVAARQARGDRIGYIGAPLEHARFARLVGAIADEASASAVVPVSLDEIAGASVWHFAAPGRDLTSPTLDGPTLDGPTLDGPTLDGLRAAPVAALNLVTTPFSGGQRWRWLLPPSPVGARRDPPAFGPPAFGPPAFGPPAFGIARTRRFRTSLTIGMAPPCDIAQEGVLHFLATLFDLKTEIEARAANFFEYRALRCPIDPEAMLNVIAVEEAAAMMLAIVDRDTDDDGTNEYVVAAATGISGEAFLETVGAVYDVSLLGDATGQPDERGHSPVDAMFARRLAGFAEQIDMPSPAAAERSWRAAGVSRERLVFDPDRLEACIRAAKDQHSAEHHAMVTRTRARPVAATAERDRQTIHYQRAGTAGPTIALINALGQGQDAWLRLIDRLAPRFRVLGWTLRGLGEDEPATTITDHVDDLAAILDREGIDRVHLVAWCTGPKIAAAFAARFPERVGSMVLLNATIKSLTTPASLDTPYERNFQSLCAGLAQRPAMAGAIRASLLASADIDETDLIGDDTGDEPAQDVALLSAMNRDLRRPVLRPFASDATLLRYVAQLQDFWSHDAIAATRDSVGPVLIVASEHDGVATPQSSQWLHQLIPDAEMITIAGATHYFLYDQPATISRLIEHFITNTDNDVR